MRYYNKSIEECLNYLKTNSDIGLKDEDIAIRHKKYGLNEFTLKEESSFWDELGKSLTEPMILILLGAAVLSSFIGELINTYFPIVCKLFDSFMFSRDVHPPKA